MIMPYKLGLEFEKKNSDMQKMVYDNEYVCSKEGSPRDSDYLDDKKFKKITN